MKRREFLKTSAAAGAAASALAGMAGCGDGSESQTQNGVYDPSQGHRARIIVEQPDFDIDAMLASLDRDDAQKAQAFIAGLGSVGAPGNGIDKAQTFHFHCGRSATLQNVGVHTRSASGRSTVLHVTENNFATHKASIFYVTHTLDQPMPDGRDVGLSFMVLYIPPESVRNASSQSGCDDNATGSDADTHGSDSNTSAGGCTVDVDIVVDDPAAETIRALLFSHPSLHQLRADRAEKIVQAVDLTKLDGYGLLKTVLSYLMKHDTWYKAVKLTDPDDDSKVYTFKYGVHKGKTMYRYRPADVLGPYLKDPMHDLVTKIGNIPELAGIFKHTERTEDAAAVSSARAAQWHRSVARTHAGSNLTQGDGGHADGFRIDMQSQSTVDASGKFGDFLDADAPTATVRFRNYFRHYVAFYVRYRDIDGNIVKARTTDGQNGKDAWIAISDSRYSAGIYNDYMDDATYLAALLNAPTELLGIPLKKYSEGSITFGFPHDAHSAAIYAVTLGHAGARDELMERLPVGMTMTFDLILPQVFLALSFAIRNEAAWVKLVASSGLSFAASFIKELIKASANKGHSTAGVSGIAAGVGTSLFLSLIRKANAKLAVFLIKEIGEAEIEDSTPILGAALMIADIATDAAELGRTGYSISHSDWTEYTEVSRSHTVQLQILPDADNFQFPEVADRFTLVLRSSGGGVSLRFSGKKERYVTNVGKHKIDGRPVPSGSELFAEGSADTTEVLNYTFDNVPEGGTIDVEVYFTAGTQGYVTAHAKYTIDNVGDVKVAFRVKQIKIALTDQSIYKHKRIAHYEGGKTVWTDTSAAPTAVYNLASDGTQPNEVSKLLSIAINDKSGALGYSFTAEYPNGEFRTVVRNISAKAMAPQEGAKKYVSAGDSNAFVLYDMLAEPKLSERNFVLVLKDDPLLGTPTYFAKSITIDPASNDFGISATKNWGKFSVAVDAAAYDPVGRVMAGIDAENRRIHLLPLSPTELDDADMSHYGNVYSVPKNIPGEVGESVAEKLEDVLFKPVAIAFTSTGLLMVIDQNTPLGDVVHVVSSKGTPVSYGAFGATFVRLKNEKEAITYLDFSVDADGYFFVLKLVGRADTADNYKLDLYAPDGTHLSQTSGMAAHKMHSDYWRNIYTLNYEQTSKDGTINEPTLSIWVPPVTGGDVISDY